MSVLGIGWEDERDDDRIWAIRLESASWVKRRYADLEVGDVFYAVESGVRIHPIDRTPDPGGEVFARVVGTPHRALRRGVGFQLAVDVGGLAEVVGHGAANSSKPGEVL